MSTMLDFFSSFFGQVLLLANARKNTCIPTYFKRVVQGLQGTHNIVLLSPALSKSVNIILKSRDIWCILY